MVDQFYTRGRRGPSAIATRSARAAPSAWESRQALPDINRPGWNRDLRARARQQAHRKNGADPEQGAGYPGVSCSNQPAECTGADRWRQEMAAGEI